MNMYLYIYLYLYISISQKGNEAMKGKKESSMDFNNFTEKYFKVLLHPSWNSVKFYVYIQELDKRSW